MNYRLLKKYRSRCISLLLMVSITVSFGALFAPEAFAQTAAGTSNSLGATERSVDLKNIKCEDLGNQQKLVGKMVTLVEEPMGKSGTVGDTMILNCYRQTKCEPTKSNTAGQQGSTSDRPAVAGATNAGGSKCTQTFVEKCQPSRQLNYETYCQPIQAYLSGPGASLFYAYVGNIYRWSAGTIGIVTVLYMVVGGIEMAASNGDSGRIEKAKERITQSIAGLALLFLSALLLYSINPNFFTL